MINCRCTCNVIIDNYSLFSGQIKAFMIPNEVDEWLDGFNTFSIYQVLPQLIELWGLNVKTDVEAKKTSPN